MKDTAINTTVTTSKPRAPRGLTASTKRKSNVLSYNDDDDDDSENGMAKRKKKAVNHERDSIKREKSEKIEVLGGYGADGSEEDGEYDLDEDTLDV
jgi:hypothetical protein